MKKKLWRIPLMILGVLLALVIVFVVVLQIQGRIIQHGRYLETKNGGAMFIDNNSPTALSNPTNRDIFKGLTTGDEILLLRSNVTLESYPGQTSAYWAIKLRDGTRDDIPAGVIEQLIQLQWIEP